MTSWSLPALVVAAALPALPAAAADVAIGHEPLACVAAHRYTRVTARGTPPEEVAAAALEFRLGPAGAWYSVAMKAEGAEWSALLPRPTPPLDRFEYRVVMRGSDLREEATAPIAVRVGEGTECDAAGRSSAAVAAPIVVRVPAGAPLVPPVPAGFSPAGVVAVEERTGMPAWQKAAIGVGLAGGVAAAVALGGGAISQPETPGDELPGFGFSGTNPVPGSALSLSRDQLSAFLTLTGRTALPFEFSWTFLLMAVGSETVCVFMSGSANVTVPPPVTVTLTGPLNRLEDCGERFDTDRSRLRVRVGNRTVFEAVQSPLPFRFEP